MAIDELLYLGGVFGATDGLCGGVDWPLVAVVCPWAAADALLSTGVSAGTDMS